MQQRGGIVTQVSPLPLPGVAEFPVAAAEAERTVAQIGLTGRGELARRVRDWQTRRPITDGFALYDSERDLEDDRPTTYAAAGPLERGVSVRLSIEPRRTLPAATCSLSSRTRASSVRTRSTTMAFYEHELPEGVQDILDRMPREFRQRILADYDSHYAPFLAMLAGWKGAVQEHSARGEASALARLEEQFFPLGRWNFPAQALAAPQRPPARTGEISAGASFDDPTGRPWTASGAGWLHPTSLREAAFVWEGDDCLCVLDVENEGATPLDLLLARGQLAFVAAPDAVVAALADAEWWALLPGQRPLQAEAERYEGYMAFERELPSSAKSAAVRPLAAALLSLRP